MAGAVQGLCFPHAAPKTFGWLKGGGNQGYLYSCGLHSSPAKRRNSTESSLRWEKFGRSSSCIPSSLRISNGSMPLVALVPISHIAPPNSFALKRTSFISRPETRRFAQKRVIQYLTTPPIQERPESPSPLETKKQPDAQSCPDISVCRIQNQPTSKQENPAIALSSHPLRPTPSPPVWCRPADGAIRQARGFSAEEKCLFCVPR